MIYLCTIQAAWSSHGNGSPTLGRVRERGNECGWLALTVKSTQPRATWEDDLNEGWGIALIKITDVEDSLLWTTLFPRQGF